MTIASSLSHAASSVLFCFVKSRDNVNLASMSCFLWSSSYSQITRWIAKKPGIFAHSLSVWLAKNRVKRTKGGSSFWQNRIEVSFQSTVIRVEKPGGNLLLSWRGASCWSGVGLDPIRGRLSPLSLSPSVPSPCCGNTDDYLTLPKALTSNGGPFIVDQSLLD